MRFLKIVLQDRASKRFLGNDGAWVQGDENATEFPNVLTAFHHVEKNQWANVEIIFARKNIANASTALAPTIPARGQQFDSIPSRFNA